jgi:hypothetical protein
VLGAAPQFFNRVPFCQLRLRYCAGGSMKLVAMTYGSEGDTRPIAALCRALMDAGHEVILLADNPGHGRKGLLFSFWID